MINVDKVVNDMTEVKTKQPSLSDSQILTALNIAALKELALEISKMRNTNG